MPSIPESVRARHELTRNFARLFHDYGQMFRPLTVFLTDLLDYADQADGPDQPFPCSIAQLQESPLRWSAQVQTHYLRVLKRRGFVRVSRKHDGGRVRRYIRVDLPAIEAAIAQL